MLSQFWGRNPETRCGQDHAVSEDLGEGPSCLSQRLEAPDVPWLMPGLREHPQTAAPLCLGLSSMCLWWGRLSIDSGTTQMTQDDLVLPP